MCSVVSNSGAGIRSIRTCIAIMRNGDRLFAWTFSRPYPVASTHRVNRRPTAQHKEGLPLATLQLSQVGSGLETALSTVFLV